MSSLDQLGLFFIRKVGLNCIKRKHLNLGCYFGCIWNTFEVLEFQVAAYLSLVEGGGGGWKVNKYKQYLFNFDHN